MLPWGGAQGFVPWAQIMLIPGPITGCHEKDGSPREGILALGTASPVPLNPGHHSSAKLTTVFDLYLGV